MEIICLFTNTFDLHRRSEQLVPRDNEPLQEGTYYTSMMGTVTISDELVVTSMEAIDTGRRCRFFPDAVRQRDRGCAITGTVAELGHHGVWWSFEAAHIYPLAYQGHWDEKNYDRWVKILPANGSDTKLNSIQNGILLRRDIHSHFDAYDVSINLDDHYGITCFSPALLGLNIAGRHLDQTFLDKKNRPTDQILRWHFRQAVLVNMRRDET
ncbi:hypothetical protein B9Z19DRAFT_1129576 [Tuber borchii]|uniref:Uncharacterized protein n=1 Tax=Tuber borchii TaxID=42251 RepID=A0A2T6ZM71_TUBBO|nr:hypothetical protein B9Z19DRAFT_1129576 [Tuber borchii]